MDLQAKLPTSKAAGERAFHAEAQSASFGRMMPVTMRKKAKPLTDRLTKATPENPTADVTFEAQRCQAHRAVVAASFVTGLEWFDVIVQGAFEVTIAELFFPTNDPKTSLPLTFGSFGISFIMRSLGGILI